jgi:hypothetical protein
MTFRRRASDRILATLVAGVCVVSLGIGTTHAAPAPDPKRQARDVMAKGSALFRRGDYEGALLQFNEAQRVYPSAKIYFNLGQTYRKMDRVAEAVAAFEKFLAEAPDADPGRRKDAEKFLAELKPRLEALRPVPPPAPPSTPEPEKAAHPPEPAAPVAQAPAPAPPPAAPVAAPRLVPTPPPESKPAPLLDAGAATPPEVASSRHRWWPWAIAGVVIGGGIAAALLITREGPLPTGSLGSADRRTR